MKVFRLPDLGEGLQEAQIVEWHVREGDEVKADDPLVAVETEKAVTEVPAPWTGRITRLYADVGGVLKVGAPVVEYEGKGSKPPAPAVAAPSESAPARAPSRSGPAAAGRAMPAVRLLARELEIDISLLEGTGPGGAVLVRDVAAAFKARFGEAKAASPEAQAPEEGYAPLTGPRRSMAQNLARSQAEVAAATVHEEASLAAWPDRGDLTVRLLRAMLAGIRAEPIFNSWFDATRGIRRHDGVHIGVAVDSPDGLLVPVLADAQARDARALRAELDRLIAAARARALTVRELRGATITLSNYGMIGGLHATPMVVPPQVAILGAGRIVERLVAGAEGPEAQPVLPLSLTYDHRAITGGEAARFIMAVVRDLESER